jgi:hypothetical protein
MTKLLQEAIAMLTTLPEDEQDRAAKVVLAFTRELSDYRESGSAAAAKEKPVLIGPVQYPLGVPALGDCTSHLKVFPSHRARSRDRAR